MEILSAGVKHQAVSDTTKISVTVPQETQVWLRERYPDSTSNSQAVVMAINDARDLSAIIKSNDTVVVGGAEKPTEK